jgi:HPt (histidine-containing phosphotransfer) domain-containing protein
MGDEDDAYMHSMLEMFLAGLDDVTEQFASAYEGRDLADLLKLVHSAKGGAASVAATRLADSLHAIEQAGASADWDLIASGVAKFEFELTALRGYVAALGNDRV